MKAYNHVKSETRNTFFIRDQTRDLEITVKMKRMPFPIASSTTVSRLKYTNHRGRQIIVVKIMTGVITCNTSYY